MLWAREGVSTPFPFVVFNFGNAIKSIKEFGGASIRRSWLPTIWFQW
jgi:hypothetical protein